MMCVTFLTPSDPVMYVWYVYAFSCVLPKRIIAGETDGHVRTEFRRSSCRNQGTVYDDQIRHLSLSKMVVAPMR